MDTTNTAAVARDFWTALDALVSSCAIRIDRPKGSAHPGYPDFRYPIDYGYLEGTHAADGNEIDVWRGSLPSLRVTAIGCTIDRVKRDSEVKLLVGCTPEEASTVLAVLNSGQMSAILVRRPDDPSD